jgi:phosphate transport system permease protein
MAENRPRRRQLRNRWSVKAADRAAQWTISIAGVATIIAVAAVCIFLVWVVIPLFLPAELGEATTVQAGDTSVAPLQLAVNNELTLAWALYDDGLLRVFDLDTAREIARPVVSKVEAKITAVSHNSGGEVALGFENGSVQLGTIAFRITFPPEEDLPEAARKLKMGERTIVEDRVIERIENGDLRAHSVAIDFKDPVEVSDSGIRRIDHVIRNTGPVFVVLDANGGLQLNTVREKENMLTGEVKLTARTTKIPLKEHKGATPEYLVLPGRGDNVIVAWKDGYLQRFDARKLEEPTLVEDVDILREDDVQLTTLELLQGRTTLLAGDSGGRVTAWFRVRPENEQEASSDGWKLVAAHELAGPDAAVTAIKSSSRTRTAALGYADGELRVYYVTNEELLAQAQVTDGAPLDLVDISPGDDELVAMSGASLWRAPIDMGHPEGTLAALFLPVWYEGYPKPEHVWQSGGGSEDFEPKLGMWPLVFGTLKATFYTMLIGAPLALLAAIYTSEFMAPRTRAKVKPTIEMMASLPSVVLGFLAALIFAPMIEQFVPVVIASFLTVPLAILCGAIAWQAAPYRRLLLIQRWRLWFIYLTVPLGFYLAYVAGPLIERWFFASDMMAWFDGRAGSATGGWMLLLFPLSAVATAFSIGKLLNPRMLATTKQWERPRQALWSAVKLGGGALAAFLLAWSLSAMLSYLGWDARGSYVDTYVQRNALVVGFVMAFAIIPIIYTLADDALSTVPRHLRSGSLGAGATTWQTAVRIVIPTAMSGLFSALMIGLGRAVGETMIVLMAAGNTPVRDLNIFNGFRTLSANIAVELPEAARNSTHFRTLYLAALTLFALTFLINTIAEMVRLRFRRRAYQL